MTNEEKTKLQAEADARLGMRIEEQEPVLPPSLDHRWVNGGWVIDNRAVAMREHIESGSKEAPPRRVNKGNS
jgi:hypothetical protein